MAVEGELANPDLSLKIGLNAGEPLAEEDDLFGTAVQIAARVTDQAEAGEIVCTNVVRNWSQESRICSRSERPPPSEAWRSPCGCGRLGWLTHAAPSYRTRPDRVPIASTTRREGPPLIMSRAEPSG